MKIARMTRATDGGSAARSGGGGSGGPSIAIFGLDSSAAPGTTVSHGQGGLGAIGAGGTGAEGPGADFG